MQQIGGSSHPEVYELDGRAFGMGDSLRVIRRRCAEAGHADEEVA